MRNEHDANLALAAQQQRSTTSWCDASTCKRPVAGRTLAPLVLWLVTTGAAVAAAVALAALGAATERPPVLLYLLQVL